MTIEIISCSISTKVWDWAGIELTTPGSTVGLATDCADDPSKFTRNVKPYFSYKSDLLSVVIGLFWVIIHIYTFVCLFDLILYVPPTIFQLNRDRSSWVEPVLS